MAKKDLALALAGLLAGCLLYVYVPLRAPAWMQTWQQVWEHISGAGLTASWLDPARLRAEGASRVLDLARRFVWPQLLPLGAILALLGAARLLLRDRGLAALLALSYLAVFGFCAAYYVADVEVFFIPAHLLAALLLGEGAMALVRLVPFMRPATDDQPRPQTLAPWSFVLGRSSLVVRRYCAPDPARAAGCPQPRARAGA